jgi:pseudaminic acid cytidylyltransferase
MNICLIPARSGSKRLKNKNIKFFFGKPLIAYAIIAAKKSNLFERIIVSTDSNKIAQIAKQYGAEVPFLRPKKLANDKAIDIDVAQHFIDYCKRKKQKISILCYLYSTNPLLKISTLKKCYGILKKKKCEKVLTISQYEYPIQRALKKNIKGQVSFKEVKYINTRSQDLTKYYQDANQCYWYNMNYLKNFKKKNMSTYAVELKRNEFYDINTFEDFEVAKQIYKTKKCNYFL